MDSTYFDRIESLRDLMVARGWDAVVITGSDPHGSEYPAERYKQVRWLTGFTGEAGDVVITADHAGLWTDTRYFIQALRQLEGSGAVLHKTRVPDQVLIPQWLSEQFQDRAVIAVDGLCMGASTLDGVREAVPWCEIVSVPDLLSLLWTDRDPIPQTPVITVESGEDRAVRIDRVRASLLPGCKAILLTALDDIAWTLNVRASDIEYNPFVISYLLITEDSVRWFVLKDPVEDPDTEATFTVLEQEGVVLERYDAVEEALSELDTTLQLDSSTVNFHLVSLLQARSLPFKAVQSPVQLFKSIKNPFEIEGMRRAHIEDGVAMEKFLFWLERSMGAERRVSEWDAAVKLGQLRSEIDGYQGDSFETISAYGPGAALPHYITPTADAPLLEASGLYLVDSGGQYFYGTTDITRTVPLGDCSQLEMEDYTLVLRAHIDLASAVFPYGTAGCQIDALAREPLWKALRNFGHGTGHGLGFFLGVHEGPQEFRQNFNTQPFLPGMVTSVEPGIYREGLHGVRHENVVLCREVCTNEFGRWLEFEPLTLCHFDTAPIIRELMTQEEISWLNAYNANVYETLSPLLPEDVVEWLKGKTAAI